MVKYRNVRHGGVVERHAADEWLEASSGWERVDDATPVELELLDDDASSSTPEDDTKERTEP